MTDKDIEFLLQREAFLHSPEYQYVKELSDKACEGLEERCRRYRRRFEVARYLLLLPLLTAISWGAYAATPSQKSTAAVTAEELPAVCVKIDNIIG